MKVYLAAPYVARDALRAYADELEVIGMTCTSSWLTEEIALSPGALGAAPDEDDAAVRQHCYADFRAVDKADVLVVFTGLTVESMRLPNGVGAMLHTGGRHIETGYALAKHKPVIVIGPAENIFHRGSCKVVEDWHRAVLELCRLDRETPHDVATERAS